MGPTQPGPKDDPPPVAGRRALALITAAVVAFDQLTKHLIVSNLAPGESARVFDDFLYLSHARNPGAAFGILKGFSGMLTVLAIAGVAALAIFLLRRPPRLVGIGAALVAGGAVGNLMDRVFRPWPFKGTVVDFVELRGRWPAFNVADSAITIGVILLLLSSFRGHADVPR